MPKEKQQKQQPLAISRNIKSERNNALIKRQKHYHKTNEK